MKSTALVLLLAVSLAGADSAPGKKHKKPANTEKQAASSEPKQSADWKRRTEGHRPQDLNGDGVITRNEWPGSDESFRELDRDGDGALTNKDRSSGVQGSRTRMYDRTVNDYPSRTQK